MTAGAALDVGVWLDASCPWAWLTARWLEEVERVRPVRVHPRLFCLGEINRGETGKARESHLRGQHVGQVLVGARRRAGEAAVMGLYNAIAEAWHEQGEPLGDPSALRRCAAAVGLAEDLPAGALDDPSTLDELIEEHRRGVSAGVFGVPTLEVDGYPPCFGPIIDVRVAGEAAGELWDHTLWLLRTPHLLELKRERVRKPDIGRLRAAP